jgi:hypothetical protein
MTLHRERITRRAQLQGFGVTADRFQPVFATSWWEFAFLCVALGSPIRITQIDALFSLIALECESSMEPDTVRHYLHLRCNAIAPRD